MAQVETKTKQWSWWARALTRAPIDLREHLHVDEAGFRMVAGPAHAASRDYFLYGTLDEIQKAGIAIMGWDELLGPEEVDEGDALTRMILQRSIEEQSFWSRKLLEALVDLAAFESTNETPYYRHYLLLRDLRGYVSTQKDLEHFYARPSANVRWSIDRVFEQIVELQQGEIDVERAWYAKNRRPLERVPRQPGDILAPLRRKLEAALEHMRPHEKLAVGMSYDRAYGQVSDDIHFRPSAARREITLDVVASGIDQVAIIGLNAILRVQDLLGLIPDGLNRQIRNSFESNEYPAQVYAAMAGGRAEVGDFVLAYGDLAEVLEVATSRFGYESYRVRYLAERPLPDIEEDWFPAQHVKRFYSVEEFFRRLDESVAAGLVPADAAVRMRALPPERQRDAVRESLRTTWDHGLRDWVRVQQALGNQR